MSLKYRKHAKKRQPLVEKPADKMFCFFGTWFVMTSDGALIVLKKEGASPI